MLSVEHIHFVARHGIRSEHRELRDMGDSSHVRVLLLQEVRGWLCLRLSQCQRVDMIGLRRTARTHIQVRECSSA